MGTYDGDEVYKLAGTCMLILLSKNYNNNDFGIYRDGVAVLKKQKWTAIRTGKEKHPENI